MTNQPAEQFCLSQLRMQLLKNEVLSPFELKTNVKHELNIIKQTINKQYLNVNIMRY